MLWPSTKAHIHSLLGEFGSSRHEKLRVVDLSLYLSLQNIGNISLTSLLLQITKREIMESVFEIFTLSLPPPPPTLNIFFVCSERGWWWL